MLKNQRQGIAEIETELPCSKAYSKYAECFCVVNRVLQICGIIWKTASDICLNNYFVNKPEWSTVVKLDHNESFEFS